MIQVEDHTYSNGRDTFIGKRVWNDNIFIKSPGILIAPAFGGLSPFEIEKAKELASRGYTVLVVDYYGNGKRASDPDEAYALMGELDSNRPKLARRMVAALKALKAMETVDVSKTGAVGYCFGGKCVLDLARTGADFQAAISIHGVYDAPSFQISEIKASVLILHGWDDPLAKPVDVIALTSELSIMCKDWQLVAFGHTGHAFTNPKAQSPNSGMMYNPRAAKLSDEAMLDFFVKKFGK